MVPSAIIRIAAIPVTPAGKVDRAALLGLIDGRDAAVESNALTKRTPPGSAIEQHIAALWSQSLGRTFVAREDNFFDLGGDSLKAIAVVNMLRRTVRCAIVDLYEHPCLADFAAVCQYQPEHLCTALLSAKAHWQHYHSHLEAYEAARAESLAPQWRAYKMQNRAYHNIGTGAHRDYANVLLTGATGYLGSYLLRELLVDKERRVTALVRGADNEAARARLAEVLRYYFGAGTTLANAPGLTVLAADLRRDDLGLVPSAYDRIASEVQAIYHSAANVKHFGHYSDFHNDNVSATARLLKLAAYRGGDFHFVSTLSACGRAPQTGFHLFTEYDAVPETLDDNYYIRSKQEAERLVIAARDTLPNASIHRVGNLVFAADGGPLQRNVEQNAFFRQLAAFLRLGVTPGDFHIWLCHVDLVARGLILLAESKGLTNQTHHLENSHRETPASFIAAARRIRIVGFDDFLDRLQAAIDEPTADAALTETLENFGLYNGLSPQSRARRLEIVSTRTQSLLAEHGLVWPPIPSAGREATLRRAESLFGDMPATASGASP
jgi:thioester reductase-like protein